MVVYGNSGPVTWASYPGMSMMTVDEETPITVLKEDLTFDFSQAGVNDFPLEGQVKAKYQMKNTTDEGTMSQMVFPFIRTVGEKDQETEILVDGTVITYDVFYGGFVESSSVDEPFHEKVELQEMLRSVNPDKYEPTNYSYDDMGTLYRISIEASGEEALSVRANFTPRSKDSRIFTKGNNGYDFDSETNRIGLSTWVEGSHTIMEIFSLDEDLDVEIKGYEDGSTDAKETTKFTSNMEVIKMNLMDYYGEFLQNDESMVDSLFALEDENVYHEALDLALENQELITIEYIESYVMAPRYVLLSYEVPFEALEEKTVEVRYNTLGDMDRRKTVVPTYTFHYFLHPAQYWKDFKDLTLHIIPSPIYSYVIESNLELINQSDGSYVGTFESLPKEDLSFTLFEQEEITLVENMKASWVRNQYFFYFAGIPVLIIVFSALLFILARRRAKV